MADMKVRLECAFGDWTSETKETTFKDSPSVMQRLFDQAKKDHPESTFVAPKSGHYLRTMVNYPDLNDEFSQLFG